MTNQTATFLEKAGITIPIPFLIASVPYSSSSKPKPKHWGHYTLALIYDSEAARNKNRQYAPRITL